VPRFCGEGEFELITVVVDILGTTNGPHAGAVHVA
jgi:hypothetical protein